MKLPIFKIEDYFAQREFKAAYVLCASDMETHSMAEILALADEESLKLWHNLRLGYTETWGLPLLRQEIAKLYGPTINADHVLCFAGAEEGIFSLFHTLLEKDDHAIVITPCYQSLEAIPASICAISKIQLQHQQGWHLDVEQIKKAIRPNTKLLVVNFPHNPTGAMIDQKTQQQVIELARGHNLWLLSDEVYRLLEHDTADRLPPMAGLYEKGLSLGVTSKAYGLAGLRLGWLVGQNKELLEKINHTKHYLSLCNSAPSEMLTLMALRAGEKILARNLAIIQENLTQLDQFFKDYSTWFEWVKPKAGCIGFPRLKTVTPIEAIADQLMEEEGVFYSSR